MPRSISSVSSCANSAGYRRPSRRNSAERVDEELAVLHDGDDTFAQHTDVVGWITVDHHEISELALLDRAHLVGLTEELPAVLGRPAQDFERRDPGVVD